MGTPSRRSLKGKQKGCASILDHGADINAQCSGACDCAVPSLNGVCEPDESVAPHRHRSMWSVLHIAICSGNEPAVRFLLSRGASSLVGTSLRLPGAWALPAINPVNQPPLRMTALQDAAWHGSVNMCRILLEPRNRRGELHRATVTSRLLCTSLPPEDISGAWAGSCFRAAPPSTFTKARVLTSGLGGRGSETTR